MIITRLQAENFKKLRAVEIVPGEGSVVPIRGRNAQGKTSVLDAIQAALGGKAVMPSRPVRAGEEAGAIRLELDQGALVVRRTFDAEGGGQIIVESGDGARYPSPQKMLDTLYASVAFDPLAFTRLDAPKQVEVLRRLVKLDVDIDALAASNKRDFEARTEKNREAKRERTILDQMPVYQDLPAEPIDTAELEQRIVEAAGHNAELEGRRANRENAREKIVQHRSAAEEAKVRAAALRAQAADLDELAVRHEAGADELQRRLDEAGDLPEPVDVSAVQAEVAEARTTNERIGVMKRRAAQVQLVATLEQDSQALTERMEQRDKERAEALARAVMPVDGLSLGEGEVLFNGIPLEQASSAEQLRVSTAIGMAGNPKLRVMLVRDGSLLDEDGEKLLATMAEENSFQLWVEAVDTSGKVGIVMEDGAVKDAPEPEPIAPKRRKKEEVFADAAVAATGGGVLANEQLEAEMNRAVERPARASESLFGDD